MTKEQKIKNRLLLSQNAGLALLQEVERVNEAVVSIGEQITNYKEPEKELLTPILSDIQDTLSLIKDKEVSLEEVNNKLSDLTDAIYAKELKVEIKDRTDEILKALKNVSEAVKLEVSTPEVDFSPIEKAIKEIVIPSVPINEDGLVPVKLTEEDLNKLSEAIKNIKFYGGSGNLSGATEATLQSVLAALGGSKYQQGIDNTGTVTYIGLALPGTATSAASWSIKKYDYTSSPKTIKWADSGNFTQIWDNRAALTYT